MHTDSTLAILDNVTTELGEQLRAFQKETCTRFPTRELKREAEARKRRQVAKAPIPGSGQARDPNQRQPKAFNLQTYKVHALGDYVSSIKTYGTTDSYTSAIARSLSSLLFKNTKTDLFYYRVNSSIALPRVDISEPAKRTLCDRWLTSSVDKRISDAFDRS
jgi:hypothetical protein